MVRKDQQLLIRVLKKLLQILLHRLHLQEQEIGSARHAPPASEWYPVSTQILLHRLHLHQQAQCASHGCSRTVYASKLPQMHNFLAKQLRYLAAAACDQAAQTYCAGDSQSRV